MNARWIALLGLGVALAQAAELSAAQCFSLSQEQVRQAIAKGFEERGIGLNGAQVVLPAKVVTSMANPALDIRSIYSLPNLHGDGESKSRAAVRMICRLPNVCLPFYAIVSWPVGMDASELHSFARTDSTANQKTNIMMRIGDHVMLVMDEGHVHIRLAVVSLANGVVGSSIRVATPDHKQVYVGQVVSTDLLRGSF